MEDAKPSVVALDSMWGFSVPGLLYTLALFIIRAVEIRVPEKAIGLLRLDASLPQPHLVLPLFGQLTQVV